MLQQSSCLSACHSASALLAAAGSNARITMRRMLCLSQSRQRCRLLLHEALQHAGYAAGAGVVYYVGCGAAAGHYAWQLYTVDLDSREDCMATFVSNKWFGAIVFSGIVMDKLLM